MVMPKALPRIVKTVVVARNCCLVVMRKRRKPVDLLLNFRQTTKAGQITDVNKNVPAGIRVGF